MATITDVRVTPDLKTARVFVSVYGGGDEETTTIEGLQSGAGFIRAELMKVLHLRPMPFLEFLADDSLARGARTLDLLDKIRDEREPDDPQSGAGGRPAPG
jgi:ribosome-binding factor A